MTAHQCYHKKTLKEMTLFKYLLYLVLVRRYHDPFHFMYYSTFSRALTNPLLYTNLRGCGSWLVKNLGSLRSLCHCSNPYSNMYQLSYLKQITKIPCILVFSYYLWIDYIPLPSRVIMGISWIYVIFSEKCFTLSTGLLNAI